MLSSLCYCRNSIYVVTPGTNQVDGGIFIYSPSEIEFRMSKFSRWLTILPQRDSVVLVGRLHKTTRLPSLNNFGHDTWIFIGGRRGNNAALTCYPHTKSPYKTDLLLLKWVRNGTSRDAQPPGVDKKSEAMCIWNIIQPKWNHDISGNGSNWKSLCAAKLASSRKAKYPIFCYLKLGFKFARMHICLCACAFSHETSKKDKKSPQGKRKG